MNNDIIGDEDWGCDGCKVTPAMRREFLVVAIGFWDDWQAEGISFHWDQIERRLIRGDPNKIETLADLFSEISGPRNWHFPFDFQYIADDFTDWL